MYDIASTSVVHVDIKSSLKTALSTMLEHTHRNIIVLDNDCFRILTIIDILNIQKKNINLDIKLSELNLSKIPTIDKDKNVLDTIDYLNNSIEYICVVNSDNTLYGLVTHTDITSNIDPETLIDNYRLVDFLRLTNKMKYAEKDAITSDLFDEIIENSFDNIIIVEKLKPIGILTTKDIMRLIKYEKNLDVEVAHYMSSPVDTIDEFATIKEALELIKKKHYKRVIVVDGKGILKGVITQKELISLSYSQWVALMKKHQNELSEINNILEDKNKEYKHLASTDSLTRLYNRHKFSELFLSAQIEMVQRKNKMSLIILDIDFFKNINDSYGHNVGDQVLIQISHTLLKNLRSIDIICRWGGEEFVLLLPTASLENASKLAEKLRKVIEELEIDIVGNITASFGIAEVLQKDQINNVVNRADKALYLAKHSGKNCIKTEDDLIES